MMRWGVAAAWIMIALPVEAQAQAVQTPQETSPKTSPKTSDDCAADEPDARTATIEFVLSKKHKDRSGEITQLLNSAGEPVHVRIKLFPFLDPPSNLGIGKCVSAGVGRTAIQAATTQGTGVTRLIRQDILPHRWVKIGSTDTAELAWIAVSADDLKRLADPALTTDGFQTLYRELAAPKERKLPFGMGTMPVEPPR
ncbi:MAG: hypothetical protein HY208_09625 [Nitrospirae bacterium]|nr:hypothetical protein [Nitrospirota bacterium]